MSELHICVQLADQPLSPKSIVHLPVESASNGNATCGHRVSVVKQLITATLPESLPDPELIDLIHCGRRLRDDQTLEFYGVQSGSTVHILRRAWPEPAPRPEPVDKIAASREFRALHTALHTSSTYRDAVFKLLGSRESLEQIVVATPGLSSDPVAMGVLQDKDLFTVFTDPSMLDTLVTSHPALVNAIILILHSVSGASSLPTPDGSAHTVPPATLHMPGGFLFDGLSDEEDEFPQASRSSSNTVGPRPASLGYTGASGPRPITQSELATALALASTPESSSHTPTPGTQGHSSGTSPMSSSVQSGTPITNDLFSQALQHALQSSSQTSQQSQWQAQLQQLRDMGIRDEDLSLRALQATGGDIQAALELIFAGGAL
ncbi:ubiquitin-like protein 7 isoform X2 [Rana temporaria]|nr:ubiquitin-like protein 7 isoform X2 [Rana temporaria]XP_040198938.1 ubiquitin-like protein 7 isoform X2 [Rana temporaria]XP_040198939.1 ubiquitin-like protein 7 isoform X2 [Rana temporaria]